MFNLYAYNDVHANPKQVDQKIPKKLNKLYLRRVLCLQNIRQGEPGVLLNSVSVSKLQLISTTKPSQQLRDYFIRHQL